MELLSFSEIIEPNSKQSEVLYVFFYSNILQKIKISMLIFNAIKFTYLLLDKTFPYGADRHSEPQMNASCDRTRSKGDNFILECT
jgi:hypothetical protein